MTKPRTVLKITTSSWWGEAGFYVTRAFRFRKKLSRPPYYIEEDYQQSSVQEVLKRIINLDCPDGLYEVKEVNIVRDWETGQIEDWKYYLVPFDPEAPALPEAPVLSDGLVEADLIGGEA